MAPGRIDRSNPQQGDTVCWRIGINPTLLGFGEVTFARQKDAVVKFIDSNGMERRVIKPIGNLRVLLSSQTKI